MDKFLVGRQPIFDARLEVYGYELLFRDDLVAGTDADSKTADILVHAGLDIGLDQLVGNRYAFINVPRSFVIGDLSISLPPDQTVIEVLEDVVHDDEMLAGCQRLVDQGYRLALDDYVYAEGDEALLELASFVKLDVQDVPDGDLRRQVEQCSSFAAQLVAEKVETQHQLATCESLAFDLYQGYLLSRPRSVGGRSLNPAQMTCLRLIEQLQDPDTSAQELADIIETDPGLSYRFLHAAPARAEQGIHRKLSSIREGVVLLGTRRLRDWVALMLLAGTHVGPQETIAIAMTRARMCELVAKAEHPELRDSAFTIGLVSALDIVLGVSIEQVVTSLSITDELVDALLRHNGRLGRILADVLTWEVGANGVHGRLGRDLMVLARSYLDALAWTNEICRALEPATS